MYILTIKIIHIQASDDENAVIPTGELDIALVDQR